MASIRAWAWGERSTFTRRGEEVAINMQEKQPPQGFGTRYATLCRPDVSPRSDPPRDEAQNNADSEQCLRGHHMSPCVSRNQSSIQFRYEGVTKTRKFVPLHSWWDFNFKFEGQPRLIPIEIKSVAQL
jgi:hypothetical protein